MVKTSYDKAYFGSVESHIRMVRIYILGLESDRPLTILPVLWYGFSCTHLQMTWLQKVVVKIIPCFYLMNLKMYLNFILYLSVYVNCMDFVRKSFFWYSSILNSYTKRLVIIIHLIRIYSVYIHISFHFMYLRISIVVKMNLLFLFCYSFNLFCKYIIVFNTSLVRFCYFVKYFISSLYWNQIVIFLFQFLYYILWFYFDTSNNSF